MASVWSSSKPSSTSSTSTPPPPPTSGNSTPSVPPPHPPASSPSYKTKSSSLPFSSSEIISATRQFKTPFHFYHEGTIRETARRLINAFAWVGTDDINSPLPNTPLLPTDKNKSSFTNFYAVKALPNPHVLRVLMDEGFGMDCSSLAELLLCEAIGLTGERIMLTSNNTQLPTFRKAKEMGALLNLDDISHLQFLDDELGLPDVLCFRYNPGALRVGNVIIGHPEDAKFGLTREQLFTAYKTAKQKGVKRFGLHTMVVSNCLDVNELAENARMCLELAVEIKDKLGIRLEFVNFGGGTGVAYLPGQKGVDFEELSKLVKQIYTDVIIPAGDLHPLRIVYENGRCITGPAGCLVTRVIHQKDTYKKYIGVDAAIVNLMRPALYKSYHHMTVIPCDDYESIRYGDGTKLELPKNRNIFNNITPDTEYDVVGSLCENNDKLAEGRSLGVVRIGDVIAVHDTGAHGHAMGFNYNGLLRSAEYLHSNGAIIPIRRAESFLDLFRTIQWSAPNLLPGFLRVLSSLPADLPLPSSSSSCCFSSFPSSTSQHDGRCCRHLQSLWGSVTKPCKLFASAATAEGGGAPPSSCCVVAGGAAGGFLGVLVGMGFFMLYMRTRCSHHS
eukprot:GHVS01076042.1.p1 GENE.GHVS01076042.1~~GHVS01076042.1.p1  ORF type:complete len:643 (+),score=106.65 GHVS01076042.1:86-1930(+)